MSRQLCVALFWAALPGKGRNRKETPVLSCWLGGMPSHGEAVGGHVRCGREMLTRRSGGVKSMSPHGGHATQGYGCVANE